MYESATNNMLFQLWLHVTVKVLFNVVNRLMANLIMSTKSHMHILNNVSPVLHVLPFSLPELASLNKQFWHAQSCNPSLESIYSLW